MLALVVWGKLRGSKPFEAGFFAFRANNWLALQLAAVCLAIPLLEVPVYSMRVRASLSWQDIQSCSPALTVTGWLPCNVACSTLGGSVAEEVQDLS